MGLCIARSLRCYGHAVHVIDQGPIPNPLSSSFDHHRLIRHLYGTQKFYASLVPVALESWSSLFEQLEERYYIETGCLALGLTNSSWTRESISSLAEMGVEYQVFGNEELRRRFTWLKLGQKEAGIYTPAGGILLAKEILTSLKTYLLGEGVAFTPHCEIASVDSSEGVLRSKSDEQFEADYIVTALGAWHPAFSDKDPSFLNDSIVSSRQTIGRCFSPSSELTVENNCPMILDMDGEAGLYLVPGSESFPMKFGGHHLHKIEPPKTERSVTASERTQLDSILNDRIQTDSPIVVEDCSVCYYAMAPQSSIILEQRRSSLSISGGSGHSFKWGALFGELLADVVSGTRTFEDVREIVGGRSTVSLR